MLRPYQRIKYPVGAACSRPFAASQTRGGGAAAPTHDFVWQALDPYFVTIQAWQSRQLHNMQWVQCAKLQYIDFTYTGKPSFAHYTKPDLTTNHYILWFCRITIHYFVPE